MKVQLGLEAWMRTNLTLLVLTSAALAADIEARVGARLPRIRNGVKIHYARLGKGPLMVMIHGFPDFWYTWRDQMASFSSH